MMLIEKLSYFEPLSLDCTMAGFWKFCPKTGAGIFALVASFSFPFKKFKTWYMIHSLFAWEARIFRKRMKMKPQEQKFMPKFWDRNS